MHLNTVENFAVPEEDVAGTRDQRLRRDFVASHVQYGAEETQLQFGACVGRNSEREGV